MFDFHVVKFGEVGWAENWELFSKKIISIHTSEPSCTAIPYFYRLYHSKIQKSLCIYLFLIFRKHRRNEWMYALSVKKNPSPSFIFVCYHFGKTTFHFYYESEEGCTMDQSKCYGCNKKNKFVGWNTSKLWEVESIRYLGDTLI